MPEVPKADITDYFEAGHTVEEFENLIRNVDDTEKVCTDVQQDQKQDVGKKRAAIQKNKDEAAGGPALVFKFLDCNYDEDGNVKSVKQLVHNFEVVMDKDSRFAGKIRLNEFAQQPYLYGTSVPELHQWLRACKRENARKKSQGHNGTKKQTKDLHI